MIRNLDIDSDYLKWYFSSPTFRNLLVSQVAGIGGSLTRAQPKQVAKYPVPLVGKEEQRLHCRPAGQSQRPDRQAPGAAGQAGPVGQSPACGDVWRPRDQSNELVNCRNWLSNQIN